MRLLTALVWGGSVDDQGLLFLGSALYYVRVRLEDFGLRVLKARGER